MSIGEFTAQYLAAIESETTWVCVETWEEWTKRLFPHSVIKLLLKNLNNCPVCKGSSWAYLPIFGARTQVPCMDRKWCPCDSRTLQSTPESGARAGYDGAKRRKGSKVHIAVDTLGHLLALQVTAADEGDRAQVAALAAEVQQLTGSSVDLAYVDQGYTGTAAEGAAREYGIRLEVVKHPAAKRGFVLLPRRWVVLPGPRASAASPAITSGSPQRSRGCTTLPSLCSCSPGCLS